MSSLKQSIVFGGRLGLEHVECRSGDPPLGERGGERLLVDDRTSRDVDEVGGGLHPRQPLGVDKMVGFLRRQRAGDHDHVRLREQPVHLTQADPRGRRGGGIGVGVAAIWRMPSGALIEEISRPMLPQPSSPSTRPRGLVPW